MNRFFEKLERIEMLLLTNKDILNVKELSVFTGWSVSHIYKLTMARMIPHFKPRPDSKMLFFKRTEIEAYLTAHKVKTRDEMEIEANNYLITKNKNYGNH